MAIVPRAQNLVELRPVTAAKFRPADPGNNFGETLQRAGQALSQFAEEQDRLHAAYDETGAKALDNAGVERARDLLDTGDKAYFKQQGLNVQAARKPTEDAIKTLHAELLAKAGNPRQRRMLEPVLQQREQDYFAAIGRHADEEVEKEDARQSAVRRTNFFNDAVSAADNVDLFRAQLDGGLHEIETQSTKRGEAPIVTDDAKKKFVSDLQTTIIQRKLLNDVDGADAYYQEHRNEIDLGTQFQLDQIFKEPLEQRKASARVDGLMGVPTLPAGPDAVGQTRSSEQMFMLGIVPTEQGTDRGGSFPIETAPEAAKLAGLPYDPARLEGDAAYAVALGKAYFAKQLSDFGSPELAAAAYDVGPEPVRKALAEGGDQWLSHLPAETQAHVAAFKTRVAASSYAPQRHDPNDLQKRADIVAAREHWTDAERQEVHSEIERRVARDDHFLSQQQAQAYGEATQQILTLGENFRTVAQLGPAFAALSPEQQQAVSEVASRNSTGRPVQTQPEALWSLRQKEATDPRGLAALDPLAYAGKLSPDDLRQLVVDQSRSIGSDGRIAPEAVRRSRVVQTAREAVEAGGIDEGKEGPARALAFLDRLQSHADVWTAENPGRSPADADLRRWAGSILIEDRGEKPIDEMDEDPAAPQTGTGGAASGTDIVVNEAALDQAAAQAFDTGDVGFQIRPDADGAASIVERMSANDYQAAYSAAGARAALEQEFHKRHMTPAQFYARLGAPGVGASVKIVDGNEAGVVSNRFSDGWRDYRFEGDHLVYYAQDANGTTAHRVIVTQAEDAFAQQGRDFAREYFKYASLVNPAAAAVQAGIDLHDGHPFSALLDTAGLSKLGAVAGEIKIAGDAGGAARTAESAGARFGTAVSNDYRATFFAANPELEGQVVVHHAVEQQVLRRYPGVVSEAEIHSQENLRGIPKEVNSDLHLSQIRREWNQFYRQNANPTQQQLLDKATEIDMRLGSQFNPPKR